MPKKERLLTVDFLLIVIVCGLGRIANHMQSVSIPLYMQSIGYTATVAGLMTTIYTIASLTLRPFIGALLDRRGRTVIALSGTLLFAVASGMFPFVRTLWILILIRILHGIGFASHATAINTMGTDVLPEERLSEGIGYMGLTNSLSTAIAPAFALMLMDRFGYHETFLSIFAIAGAAVLLCLPIRYEKKQKQVIRRKPEKVTWSGLFEKSSLLPSVLILVMAGANVALGTFLAIYTDAVGLKGAGMFFTVNAIAMTVSRLFGGKVTQRIGERAMMYLGMLFCITGYILIFVSRTSVVLWSGAALYGLGYGVVYPLLNAMAVVNAPPSRRGAANATFLMLMDLGIGLGSFLWGIIIDWLGIRWLYLFCAFTVVLATLLYFWLSGREKKPVRENL